MSTQGTTSYILSRKIEEVKLLLKNWNRDYFERLEVNKKLALSKVEVRDCVEEERVLTLEEIFSKMEVKDSFNKLINLEEFH